MRSGLAMQKAYRQKPYNSRPDPFSLLLPIHSKSIVLSPFGFAILRGNCTGPNGLKCIVMYISLRQVSNDLTNAAIIRENRHSLIRVFLLF
ncbi:hypothetical protein PSDVSF_20420 [Pseudodesulfovibrio sediminis]|uniref:Uncharacterized protein n=1 Tax=Pseudodesulfovibrio sediminis TaxID=2810563 RepID=A0ABM7P764_9BACT|nr:hypothetical protein PSDVSF_20420 [Pseudodesulfovibrio sediminis]